MGTGLINTFKTFPQVVDRRGLRRLRAAPPPRRSRAGGTPEAFGDFRRVLDRKDIDAVVIATPDHWHAIIAILACQAGKDVYCEKPLAHRIQEGRAMVDAAEKYKRVTQMGNLIHAEENYHRVVEIVRSGVLGKISKTRVWMAADRAAWGGPRMARRPRDAITISGSAPPPSGRSTPTDSRSTGDTSGITAAGSSPTSAATSSTSSTGPWTSRRPGRSPPPAADTPSTTMPRCPTRSRSLTSTRRATGSS